MAATVLNSPQAVAMSIYVVRAFMQMREQLAANAAILKRLAEIDKTLLEHDGALRAIWTKLQPLLAPPPERPRKRISGGSVRPWPTSVTRMMLKVRKRMRLRWAKGLPSLRVSGRLKAAARARTPRMPDQPRTKMDLAAGVGTS